MSLILDSTFAAPRQGHGTVRLRLVNAGPRTWESFTLGFTSIVQLTPPDGSHLTLVRRTGSYHEIAPPPDLTLGPGAVWDLGPLECEHQLVHANDGPLAAFLITAGGETVEIRVPPTQRGRRVRVGDDAPRPLALVASGIIAAAWDVAAACEHRLYPDDAPALSRVGEAVTAKLDGRLQPEQFAIDGLSVTAGSEMALQWAFMELARQRRGDSESRAATWSPRHAWRGVMLDLSRHFHPAADVDELIDVAAWRRLNRVHLHLTDDQGWRLPVDTYPALAEVAAWRGHGLPVPPLHGSGGEAYGGSYTAADIRRWVARASALGIEIIPEIDVPGHCFAAIATVAALRDDDDQGAASSVQHFPHNVLNPGLGATEAFLEAVFGAAGELFTSPWIHIGADEVPKGAWASSPAATAYATRRGATSHAAIEAAFVRDIISIVRRATGKRVGAWQEAALCGGMDPDDGYVVGWKSAADCQRLAKDGFNVVAAPAEAYYLDMATGPEWHLPGTWWAGYVTRDKISGFDPGEGWDRAELDHLLGVQACLWAEHVADRATMRALLLPRLDGFGDAAWTVEPAGS